MPVIDELLPKVEKRQADGAVILLKWDEERAEAPCTVLLSRQDSGYRWRKDSADMSATLRQALADYFSAHEKQDRHLPCKISMKPAATEAK